MATNPQLMDDEEREISRGGKNTAIWTVCLALALISAFVAAVIGYRTMVDQTARPHTTPPPTPAGANEPAPRSF
jgi:hypothetical protein